MRICLVSPDFPPHCAGVGHSAFNLGRKLAEREHKVTVLTRGPWCKTQYEHQGGMEVYRLPFQMLPPYHVQLHGLFVNRWLRRRGGEFDLIHLNSPLVPTLKTRTPKAVTFHVTWKYEGMTHRGQYDKYSLYVRLFQKWFIRTELETIGNADAFMTVSKAIRKQLQEYGVDPQQVSVIGNGANTEYFRPGTGAREKQVLYIGRLNFRKGLLDLVESALEVLRKHPDSTFVLIGEGDFKPALLRRIQQLGLADFFSFLGYMPQADLIAHLQKASVYVLPSYYEGLPQTLLEAMACGLPAVATDVSGTSELLVDGETGYLVPPGDPEKLATAITELLDDEGLRERMGAAGRQRIVEQFTWDAVADRVLSVYGSLMG